MRWIDSHVHVWTPDTVSYPTKSGTDWDDRFPKDFTPETLFRYARPSQVQRFVLVAHQIYYGTDNSYMLDAVQRWPEVFRIVGFINHRGAKVSEEMQNLQTLGVTGFRIVPDSGKEMTWLQEPGYSDMFNIAAETGQSICPLIRPKSMPELDRMCKQHPNTSVVIDHLASVGLGGDLNDEDVKALCSMAINPNVCIKVSAFYALGLGGPPHDDLAPLIERVVDAFGSERIMWGSDSPYHVQYETYEDSIKLVRDKLNFLSEADQENILCKTAERVFFSA